MILRAQAEQREQAIAAVLENNVSLRFEINTYRRLLEVEEGHLQRIESGEGLTAGLEELHHYIIINQDHQLVQVVVQAFDKMQVQMYQPKK